MEKLLIGLFTLFLFTSSSPSNLEVVTENEKEWVSLFDGKTLNVASIQQKRCKANLDS